MNWSRMFQLVLDYISEGSVLLPNCDCGTKDQTADDVIISPPNPVSNGKNLNGRPGDGYMDFTCENWHERRTLKRKSVSYLYGFSTHRWWQLFSEGSEHSSTLQFVSSIGSGWQSSTPSHALVSGIHVTSASQCRHVIKVVKVIRGYTIIETNQHDESHDPAKKKKKAKEKKQKKRVTWLRNKFSILSRINLLIKLD